MSDKQSIPGKGKTGAYESFSYWGIPVSPKPRYAWVAGKCQWYECHEHTEEQRGTKVCLRWYTDEQLKCPRCRGQRKLSTIGYLPVWREEDLKPSLLVLHDTVSDLVKGLKFGDYVLCGKVDSKSSTFAKLADTKQTWKSDHELRKRACWLLPSLLMVWGYPELEPWLRLNGKYRIPQLDQEQEEQPAPPAPPAPPARIDLYDRTARGIIAAVDGEQPETVDPAKAREAVYRMTGHLGQMPEGSNGKPRKPR